jgi:hypothetical protein
MRTTPVFHDLDSSLIYNLCEHALDHLSIFPIALVVRVSLWQALEVHDRFNIQKSTCSLDYKRR